MAITRSHLLARKRKWVHYQPPSCSFSHANVSGCIAGHHWPRRFIPNARASHHRHLTLMLRSRTGSAVWCFHSLIKSTYLILYNYYLPLQLQGETTLPVTSAASRMQKREAKSTATSPPPLMFKRGRPYHLLHHPSTSKHGRQQGHHPIAPRHPPSDPTTTSLYMLCTSPMLPQPQFHITHITHST